MPTRCGLAKLELEAGEHVFVEKPPAMHAAQMEGLSDLADGAKAGSTCPATCSSTTQAVDTVEALIKAGDLERRAPSLLESPEPG